MRKIVFSLLMFLMVIFSSQAQTAADFDSDTVCVGTKSTLVSQSISTGNITALNWDLDNDGQYDDATGQVINPVFDFFRLFPINLKQIVDQGRDVF